MATKTTGNVRIGPISLLTLISVLLLAVLGMLCITTSNAAGAMSRRQASAATSTYALESCAQAFLAGMDETAHTGGTDAASAATAVSEHLDALKDSALDESGAKNLTIDAKTDGASIEFSISAKDGRRLNACVTFSDDLSYSIDRWKTTTTHVDESESMLWSGSTAN